MDSDQTAISLDRSICNDLQAARRREWLVTNSIGGYAMGTVAGLLTRSYHGLLIAALDPPLGRTLLLANLEEAVEYKGKTYELFSNSWQQDTVTPEGYLYIESFRLDGTTPVWVFAVDDARIEKRVWMALGENTTYIRYTVLAADKSLKLHIQALANYRDHHARSQDPSVRMDIEPIAHGIRITAPGDSTPFYLYSKAATMQPQHIWHENLFLSAEAERGLGAYDNDLLVGTLDATLTAGKSLAVVASTESKPSLDEKQARQLRADYETSLIVDSPFANAPAAVCQLVLATDQFIVQRATSDDPKGCSVIAGYPWFGDWGRDTMISLPGLTLQTGRQELAAKILRTFAQFVDQGMLPNRFPDASETPEYNTVDATLWYFQAIRAYHDATNDNTLLRELFSVLREIINWHYKGTRHQIHVDPTDHLLYAGEPGVQLTWMDAKYDDRVVTPRIGKPIEINALWFNALKTMADIARELGYASDAALHDKQARQVERSFERFWDQTANYCYDVLDGPDGHEALLRPNQILAVSLPYSPLDDTQQEAIVDACSRSLLTPYGLRSLAPDQPGYIGHYEGDTENRDGAYHQGTAWAWLIGPFVEAHLRVYKDPERARSFLEPLLKQHLYDYGLGSISEIFDGDMPYTARGCPEQAWSVAELLRAWRLTQDKV